LPWFRWLKKQEHDAAVAAAATQQEAPAPAEQPADAPEDDASAPQGAGTQPKRRRRGSRGGRGRKKPAGAGASADGEVEPPATVAAAAEKPKPARRGRAEGAAKSERGAARRSSARAGARRRPPPRRAPLPAAKRELLISVDVGEQRVAMLEDDRVAEVYLERPERRSIAGNIYLGVVDNVLPGMEAAFVEIGLEKNGFLYVDEIVVPELEGKARQGKRITDLIQRGQQLLVQAVKDPMKSKGARLTTEISLPGRFLVYVPYGEGLGVSRRLEDAERQRLKEILKGLQPKQGGIIVRTAADGASAEDLERDLVFLERLWKTIQARAKAATAPELVYQEAELPLRIIRDLFAGDFVSASVDNDRAHRRIVGYLKKTSPHMVERVHRYKEKEPLFESYGVEAEIASTLNRRVDLPSGGYLIFDYAEAFTVIDVNTGRFVGSRSKTSAQRLEDTIVKNNLEAVKEVVRQLRLRDIGGIIVIDFIDMANPKNRESVEEALRTELERDRTKTYVVEISPLGLVEMTRQNVTDGPREIMTRRCPTCDGDGIVVSDTTMALDIERRLRALATASTRGVQAFRVAVHPRILAVLAGPGGARLAALEEETKRRFFLVPAEGHAHSDHLEVLAEGKSAELAPESALDEGAELELRFVEVGLHDPSAGVAKLDGREVVVAGAAKLVGKKATVRVGRVLDGQVLATLVEAEAPPAPITFESEAEKPTRAPGRRKVASAEPSEAEPEIGEPEVEEALAEAAEPAEAAEADETAEPADAVAEEIDAQAAVEAPDEEQKPKRKTRRGSRGGRHRKKKPAEAAETDAAGAEAGEPEAEPEGEVAVEPATPASARDGKQPAKRRRSPRIHVPQQDIGEPGANGGDTVEPDAVAGDGETPSADGEPQAERPPRKKTRRGSRGGRGRRKPPEEKAATTPGDAAAGGPVSATALPPDDAVEAYVPMAEWLDDFDRQ
jgi:ribonuclease G